MIRLALAAEDAGGEFVAQTVTDMVILAASPWIERDLVPHLREWTAFEGQGWLALKRAFMLARSRGLRVHGRFHGEHGALDAQMIRAALLLVASDEQRPDVVVIARDIDGLDERRRGFEQAVQDRRWPFVVVGALADPESEAWLVASWTANDAEEATRHEALRRELGFCPVASSHRLASTSTSPKDSKRVLAELTSTGRSGRERFESAPLADLKDRSEHNGLTAFVRVLEAALPPLLGERAPHAR